MSVGNRAFNTSMGRLYARLFKYKGLVIISFVSSAISGFLGAVSIATIIPYLNTFLEDDRGRKSMMNFAAKLGPLQSSAENFIINHILPNPTMSLLIFSCFLVFIAILKGVFKFAVEYSSGLATNLVINDLQNDLYRHLLDMDYAFYQKTGVSQIISRFTNDIENIFKGIKTISGKVFEQPFRMLWLFILCLLLNAKLTLIAITALPFIGFGVVWIGSYARKKGKKMLRSKDQLMLFMSQAFGGIRIVRIFGGENLEKKKFREENENILKQNMKIVKAESMVSPLLEIVGIISVSAAIIVGYQDFSVGLLSRGAFVTFYISIIWLIDPIRKLGNVNARLQHCLAGAERVFEFLDTPITVMDKPEMPALAPLTKNLRAENLGFEYQKDQPVLFNVTFNLSHGKSLAVVGPSGSGKSTLINLIARFYEPLTGNILIDGQPVSDYSLQSLRAQIGMVTQETLLFQDTVHNNIAYGDKRGLDRDKVIQAAKSANAHEFIMGLENGYDTVIGEGGSRLSGGQRQRIAIARAIYKDPALLILDEATSNLDSESEAAIQKALSNFMKDRTTIVIAHRLSTIERADQIMVLNGGKLEDLGKHSELLQRSQTYRNLYERQFAPDAPTKSVLAVSDSLGKSQSDS